MADETVGRRWLQPVKLSRVATSPELMDPWRSRVLHNQWVREEDSFGPKYRWDCSSRFLAMVQVTFHCWFQVPRPLDFWDPPTVSLSHCLYWCWWCYDFEYCLMSEGVYQSPSHWDIFLPVRVYLFNCIDMYVLLQYDIGSICHFGSVLVRSHPGATGSRVKNTSSFMFPYTIVI